MAYEDFIWWDVKGQLTSPVASAIVYKEGDYAVAKIWDETYGRWKRVAKSTDHASVIQEAIDAKTLGNKILIAPGNYTITDTIVIGQTGSAYRNIVIEGMNRSLADFGFEGTVFEHNDAKVFDIPKGASVCIKGISFENIGDTTTETTIHAHNRVYGLYIKDCRFYKSNIAILEEGVIGSRIENCIFNECGQSDYAIKIRRDSTTDEYSTNPQIIGCGLASSVVGDIFIEDVDYGVITRSYFEGNVSESHIKVVRNAGASKLGMVIIHSNFFIYGNSHITLNGSLDTPIIAFNEFHDSDNTAVDLDSANRPIVIGNGFSNNNPGTGYHINNSSAWQGIIALNLFNPFIDSSAYLPNPQDGFRQQLIRNNHGLVNENSGMATFSGDGSTTQFAIEHGLVSTPSKVLVTPGSQDAAGDFYTTADATYIYVNYTSPPPSGTDNIVLYWYAKV